MKLLKKKKKFYCYNTFYWWFAFNKTWYDGKYYNKLMADVLIPSNQFNT